MANEQTLLYRYPGTKPFEAADYALFKGRDEDILKLFDLVFVENPVVLFSRSGLGKSSLLNAGLYNKIINENKATPLFIRFGACYKDSTVLPLEKLSEVINKEKGQEQNALFEKLILPENDQQYSLWYTFKNIQVNDPAKNSFVLIFDQFEELFTYPQHAIDRFKKELAELVYTDVPQTLRDHINEKLDGDANYFTDQEAELLFAKIDIRVLFAIRSDKLSLMNGLTGLFPTILKNCYELKPLNREQARQAIIFPAQLTAGNFESKPFVFTEEVLNYILDSLTETINQDLIRATAVKPEIETFQLQIVCKYAEDLVIEKGLTEITKNDLGDIKLIFENQYKNIINKIPEGQQLPARIMMEEKLIVEKIRVSMPEISLLNELKAKGLTKELVDSLVNTHIIRRDQGGAIEISHDTLVEPILKSRKEREDKEELARLEAERQEELRQQKEKAEIEKLELAKTRKQLRNVYGLLGLAILAIVAASFFWINANNARKVANNTKDKLQEFLNTVIGAKYQGGIIAWKDSTGNHGLIAAEKDLDSTYSWAEAMQACKRFNRDGDSAWHLPTLHELNKLYVNMNAIGGFADDTYWSSAGFGDRVSAGTQAFNSGIQAADYKNAKLRVRPVRAF